MISWWLILLLSVLYVALLFAIAHWGDKPASAKLTRHFRPLIYSLTLGVYCTSWTFYGAVGTAARTGWGYLPIYLGPILTFVFAWGLVRRIVSIARSQNLTSIADFISARYGKGRTLAVLVTTMAVAGSVPYIALQLKAVASGFEIVTTQAQGGIVFSDAALLFAALLALFAILFGTRQLDASEHHHGMMLAIAFESVVKLLAFVAVGVFSFALVLNAPATNTAGIDMAGDLFSVDQLPDAFVTQTLLAAAAVFCLPRQFHVMAVESDDDTNLRPARWLFPLYLLCFAVFVVPITYAGLTLLPTGAFSNEAFVLALPMSGGRDALTTLAFLGGFSAATGMVIVASVTLATMVSNEIVMPSLFSIKRLGLDDDRDYAPMLLQVRRVVIVAIIGTAYAYYLIVDQSAVLASIGLLSFAAAAQFAPLIVLGILWPNANRLGAVAGLSTGIALWTYTLFLPSMADFGVGGLGFVEHGPFGIVALRPEALLIDVGLHPLSHGVAWSLLCNIAVLMLVSRFSRRSMSERIAAGAFSAQPTARPGDRDVRSGDIKNADLLALAERIVGRDNAETSLHDFASEHALTLVPQEFADDEMIRFTERLLAGAVGTSSARVIITAALRRRGMGIGDVVALLDETSQAIRFNRQLLEATLANMSQGVSVIDASQRLIGWNASYLTLMDYSRDLLYVGKPIEELLEFNAARGHFAGKEIATQIDKRLAFLRAGSAYRYESTFPDGRVIEIQGRPMPDGGYVSTYSDISESKAVQGALVEARDSLEQRVLERTNELSQALNELKTAKTAVEDAHASKTRFFAAAAHDLLQPINAAKLFGALLIDSSHDMPDEQRQFVERIEMGLVAVEDLLNSLLEISHLDAGTHVPELKPVSVQTLFDTLDNQFSESCRARGLRLRFVPTDIWIDTDAALMRRILQNFISNAQRYTKRGGITIGVRRRRDGVALCVYDTGVGIALEDQKIVFKEFERLPNSNEASTRGIGLGLAIVQRIARLLEHRITMRSVPGRGSCFEVLVPRAATPVRDAQDTMHDAPDQVITTLAEAHTVICVDNEPDILDGMQALLTRWGLNPYTARDLLDAEATMTRVHDSDQTWPSLLLVDYHLDDDRTGLEVIEHLRQVSGVELPAAVLTADRGPKIREEIEQAGHRLLYKPIKPAALRALITRMVKKSRAA